MLNFITRYFSSAKSFFTSPFRAIWRGIKRVFPQRDFTVMDVPNGTVYSFHQSSFWRFTKFIGKITLIIWATWSTYVFYNHRPMLQKRTQQLAETRAEHSRQISDMEIHLKKFNELVRELNATDDKILNAKNLPEAERDSLMKKRVNIWAELEFLKTRMSDVWTDIDYKSEFTVLSELELEYNLIRAQNESLTEQNNKMTETMIMVADTDAQIVDAVSKLTTTNIDELRANVKRTYSSLNALGLNESAMVKNANKLSNSIVGTAFLGMQINKALDERYKRLADGIELWNGLRRLDIIMPIGAPSGTAVTSEYGMRKDPFNGKPTMHSGIDFSGTIGSPLATVAPGRVISAGDRSGYGKTVEIDHGLGFTTLYAHLSKINVARGANIRAGTIVGLAGNTGRSTGPHLHYEIRYNGKPFNPSAWVKE